MRSIYRTYQRQRRKRHPLNRKICTLLIVILLILALIAAFLFYLYCSHPSHIENADILAKTEIINVIGDGYNSSYSPTRQEVLQIISNVFCSIKQKGFRETKDVKDTIQQAIQLGILQGNGSSLYLERQATRQESLVFIGRSLAISKDIDSEEQPDFLSTTLFDDWAKSQIEGLVILGYLDAGDIDRLHNLRQLITVSELEYLLNYK